jgi:tripartite-type tricarboxylate transporter receptor subunit TctC
VAAILRTRALLFLFSLLGLATAGSPVLAQDDWPTQPLTIIVPFTPGGSNDVTARLLAPALSERLGQSVIVENRPGGGGYIGVGQAARAKPDGQTLLISSASSHLFANLMKKDASYDPREAFSAIGMINDVPLTLAASPDLGVESVEELLAKLKENPKGMLFGSSGTGSSTHFAGELFAIKTGAKLTHVPYPGGSQALNDLMTGRVQLAWLTLPTAQAQGEAGTIRNLGITSEHRVSISDLPAIHEQGVPGYSVGSWTGLFVPQGTPKPVIDRLAEELHGILEDPAFRKQLVDIGSEPAWMGPADADAFIRKEFDLWTPVVQQLGLAK